MLSRGDINVGKLVAVLLADPLSPRASWEDMLEESISDPTGIGPSLVYLRFKYLAYCEETPH